jgi:uncharacterized protein (DUF302 family)
MIQEIKVSHHEYGSSRSFEDVVAAFESAVGTVEDTGFPAIVGAAAEVADFETRMTARIGPSGFTRFLTVDHGAWLPFHGKAAKLRMYTIGNPMIAYTMLRHDVAAGLNVPVRVMIYEHPRSGSVKFAFDQPSSLMSLGSDQLAEAARKLDDKLVALAQHVTA